MLVKSNRSLRLFVLVNILSLLITGAVVASFNNEGANRWDKRLIRSAPIWERLIYKYAGATSTKKKDWPNRKKRLQEIVDQFPQSEYVDDAELAIACGVAAWEGNLDGSVQAFTRIISKYPEADTILYFWAPEGDWTFDPQWIRWAPGRVTTDANGQIISSRPFGGVSSGLSARERAALLYFQHLGKYPRYTKDIAFLNIVAIRLARRKIDVALKELEGFTGRNHARMVKFNESDRIAAEKLDGIYVRGILRPVIRAYQLMTYIYASQGKLTDAISVGNKLVKAVSCDGWYWQINEHLADLYKKNSKGKKCPEAAKQYGLALQGYRAYIKKEAEFIKACHGTLQNVPVKQWQKQILELKKSILEMGGKADLNKDELKDIKALFAKKQKPFPQGLSEASVTARLRPIYNDKKKYPGPKDRVRAVEALKAWFLSEANKANANDKGQVVEARKTISLGLAHLAMYEPDIAARKAMLSCAGSLITYRPSKGDPGREKLAELKQKVDSLVQSMLKAKGKDKDAEIDALKKELLALPEDSMEFVAEHLADPELPTDIKVPISDALWNRISPRAYEAFLKVIETNNTQSRIVRAAISGIKAALLCSIIDKNGIMTERKEKAPVIKVKPKDQRARKFRLRKGVRELIKDKRTRAEDKMRAQLLAYAKDDKEFEKFQEIVNRRWDKESVKYLGSLLLEDWDKEYALCLQRPRVITELLIYVRAHEKPRGFLDNGLPVVTIPERKRVPEVRKAIDAALDKYYRALFDADSKWPSNSVAELQYNLTRALENYGTPEMITETIWEGMASNDKFRFNMLGVLSSLSTEATKKRLLRFSRSRDWPEKDRKRLDMAIKAVDRRLDR